MRWLILSTESIYQTERKLRLERADRTEKGKKGKSRRMILDWRNACGEEMGYLDIMEAELDPAYI